MPENEIHTMRVTRSDAALGWAEAFVSAVSIALEHMSWGEACDTAYQYACERVGYSPWAIAAGLDLLRRHTAEGQRIMAWWEERDAKRAAELRASSSRLTAQLRSTGFEAERVVAAIESGAGVERIPVAPMPAPKGSR